MISVPIGRFPRARLQPPRREKRTPAGSSARAVPAGVADFHSNQLECTENQMSNPVDFRHVIGAPLIYSEVCTQTLKERTRMDC